MAIRQITIIGTGLIGGSFGLALKKRRFRGRIVGCDREPVLKRAQKLGVIDAGESNPLKAVCGSQIVLLKICVVGTLRTRRASKAMQMLRKKALPSVVISQLRFPSFTNPSRRISASLLFTVSR